MCKGEGNYTFVHYKNGEKHLFSKTLKQFCELFEPYDFLRISRSVLINLKYLKAFNTAEELSVIMINEQKIDIARRRKAQFQDTIRKHLAAYSNSQSELAVEQLPNQAVSDDQHQRRDLILQAI